MNGISLTQAVTLALPIIRLMLAAIPQGNTKEYLLGQWLLQLLGGTPVPAPASGTTPAGAHHFMALPPTVVPPPAEHEWTEAGLTKFAQTHLSG